MLIMYMYIPVGNIDSTTYEDTCREMFGVHAYVIFTIDRLVQNTVRQVHMFGCESCNVDCVIVYVHVVTVKHVWVCC